MKEMKNKKTHSTLVDYESLVKRFVVLNAQNKNEPDKVKYLIEEEFDCVLVILGNNGLIITNEYNVYFHPSTKNKQIFFVETRNYKMTGGKMSHITVNINKNKARVIENTVTE